ncbi:hypothetical protein DEO72_LG6g598 [Vigna unguiculata]|uniref:Uncharacterized protein n=1 Tax=Vigna unguiculata TaxID=3917 RepID=A0A4D6M5Y7_VIGUN|nr:hypothetical protein DEO72_LG6g598 [Vigna unguiculata]
MGLREPGAWQQGVTRQVIAVKQGLCAWAWRLAMGLVPLSELCRFRLATLRRRQATLLQFEAACVAFKQ